MIVVGCIEICPWYHFLALPAPVVISDVGQMGWILSLSINGCVHTVNTRSTALESSNLMDRPTELLGMWGTVSNCLPVLFTGIAAQNQSWTGEGSEAEDLSFIATAQLRSKLWRFRRSRQSSHDTPNKKRVMVITLETECTRPRTCVKGFLVKLLWCVPPTLSLSSSLWQDCDKAWSAVTCVTTRRPDWNGGKQTGVTGANHTGQEDVAAASQPANSATPDCLMASLQQCPVCLILLPTHLALSI